MSRLELRSPSLMEIRSPGGGSTIGGSQEWYSVYWQRLAGCGPTNGSNLVWYLARSRPGLSMLYDVGNADRAAFIRLMEYMFQYITPGMRGVNTTDLFRDGALAYAAAGGVSLSARVLPVPPLLCKRPDRNETCEFLSEAIADDLPVAFLNLSNGAVKNLDRWHWVTLIAFDPDTMMATMCDQGYTSDIDLGVWLNTSTLGGGFVVLEETTANAESNAV